MFGNVRGGSWYLHHEKFEKQNLALQRWMKDLSKGDNPSKVVVIEIGAGYNTPTVTRFPMESFVRELNGKAKLIRINPTEPEVPEDLQEHAIAINEGWQVLEDISHNPIIPNANVAMIQQEVRQELVNEDVLTPPSMISHIRRHMGHFDWKIFLNQLRQR